ncbi:Aste57867_9910 [Aphanomyces stellatus]|uniref:Aste57867_9910 protein n=1 Tax=Aphanomyces stellatus TaxID=120398 RepID=A0A485KPB1_9STRA|nr:hypothetical protein As57867_009871 [Aphanomyces stellatus]VFT86789.1 Aste57867_9910 [Aphanomyces stellatus]
MKFTTATILSAAFLASSSAQSADQQAALVCVKSVQTALTQAVASTGAAACAKEAGFSLSSNDVSDAALAKYVASAACQSWYKSDIVGALAKISPPCVFPNGLDGKSAQLSTAKFDLSFTDFTKWVQTTAGAASSNSSNTTTPATTAKPSSSNTTNSTTATTISPSSNNTVTVAPAATTTAPTSATTAVPATTAKSSSIVSTVSVAALVAIAAMYA